jgi:hypothetical protein
MRAVAPTWSPLAYPLVHAGASPTGLTRVTKRSEAPRAPVCTSAAVCKPEVTGSIPVRSTEKGPGHGPFFVEQGLHRIATARLWKHICWVRDTRLRF